MKVLILDKEDWLLPENGSGESNNWFLANGSGCSSLGSGAGCGFPNISANGKGEGAIYSVKNDDSYYR